MRNNVDDSVGNLITFDWGNSTRYVPLGDITKVKIVPTIQAMVLDVEQIYPHISSFAFACEATFMSYPISHKSLLADDTSAARCQERDDAINFVRSRGHDLFVYESRITANERRNLGLQKKGETLKKKEKDPADDIAILSVARRSPLRRARLSTEYNYDMRALRQRTSDWLNKYRFSKCKSELVEFVIMEAQLPHLEDKSEHKQKKFRTPIGAFVLSEAERAAWDNGCGRYHKGSLAVVIACAVHARTQKEFDQLLGFSENAPGSLMRSDIVYHRWRKLNEKKTITRGVYQRCLRQMYRDLRDAGIIDICARFVPSITALHDARISEDDDE